MEIFIVIAIIFLVAFIIQRKASMNAKRLIGKLIPVIVLTASLVIGYIVTALRIHAIKDRGIYTSMAIDEPDIFFIIFAIGVLTAITGCIFGLVFQKIKQTASTKHRKDR